MSRFSILAGVLLVGSALVSSVLVAAALAAPTGKPPKKPAGGVPPAWIETAASDKWLSYGSYCWTTVCADMLAPRCSGLGRVVRVPVKAGEIAHIHLGFKAGKASMISVPESGKGDPHQRSLGKGNVLRFKVDRFGPVALFTQKKGGGDASYTACLVRVSGASLDDGARSVH